jgi:hypothetical protein
VEVAATIEVLEGSELDPLNARPLWRERFDVKADYELVDRESAAIEIVPDYLQLRRQVEAAVQVPGAEAVGDSGVILVRYSVTRLPVSLAYAVTVRQGTHQWKGTMTSLATVNSSGGFLVPAKDFPGDRVDVTLEPDVKLALDTVDVTTLWNGRLEFHDVPIQRPASPTTQP